MTRWDEFSDDRAGLDTDFQATGRSRMDVVSFLHTVAETARLLELGPDDEVLDVRCGTGLMVLAIGPYVRPVHGLDISQGMVAATGCDDRSADKVVACGVIQYLAIEEEASAALREVRRVLRPGGRSLLATNPDPERRPAYEAVLREGPQNEDVERSIELLDELLWLAPARAVEFAAAVGLEAPAEAISSRIWQHFYMYDLVVEG